MSWLVLILAVIYPVLEAIVQTQTIGKSDLVASRLAYGCMRYLGPRSAAGTVTPEQQEIARQAVRAAFEAGYTLYDHADIYGRGDCEKAFGVILKEMPELRRTAILATKCGILFPGQYTPDAPHRYDFSAKHIAWSCEQSLTRLGIETIDIYQLHRPDLLMDPAEVAGAFEKLHAAGKVRWFGVSNFVPSFVSLLQKFLRFPLVVNQVEISMKRLACFYDGTLDQCLMENITPLSWSPLGGGLLGDGGKVPDTATPAQREGWTALQKLMDEIAQRYGVTRTVLGLAWLLKHPARIVPIVGSSKPGHIRDAVQADGVELSREDWYRLLVAARMEKLP